MSYLDKEESNVRERKEILPSYSPEIRQEIESLSYNQKIWHDKHRSTNSFHSLLHLVIMQ